MVVVGCLNKGEGELVWMTCREAEPRQRSLKPDVLCLQPGSQATRFEVLLYNKGRKQLYYL